jgi:methionine synthase II (cobalamin-independent)
MASPDRRTWKGLPPFSATGIGSVPFPDPKEACRIVLAHREVIPFWPQLVRKDPREDMLLQYSPPLPCLTGKAEATALVFDPGCRREEALVGFYERFLVEDLDYFSLRPEYAAGFFTMLELLKGRPQPPHWLKGQIVGPITLGMSVKLEGDRFLIHDPELMDTVIKGLAFQAVFQIKSFEGLGARSILFLDEPGLSGYGSAFSPLTEEEVRRILGETIALIRERSQALIGLHCCGNSDWSLLLSLDLDIINLDAYGYGPSFLLYAEDIQRFLERDKAVAWGIVPTAGATGREEAEDLLKRLEGYFHDLVEKGLDPERLYTQALLTPACGMGTLSEDLALKLLALLAETSRSAQERFS